MSSGNPRRGPMTAAPPPVPVDVGIVAALPIEVAPLDRRASRTSASTGRRDRPSSRAISAASSSPSSRPAWAAPAPSEAPSGSSTATARAGSSRPGSPGRSTPKSPERGDPVRPRWRTSRGVISPTDWPPAASCRRSRSAEGRLLTTDEVVLKADQQGPAPRRARGRPRGHGDLGRRRALPRSGHPLPRAPGRERRRDVDLPPEILTIMGESGSYRLGAALGAIWRRPSSLKEMLALREQAAQAAARLTEALLELLPCL